jgi:transcriptional regulator GlxA family with amidase domain
MKTIYILAIEHSVVQAIAGTQYCFDTVNFFLNQQGKAPAFETRLVGLSSQIHPGSAGFSIAPDLLLEQARDPDLIIIPPLFGDFDLAIEANKPFIPWIQSQFKSGAEIASLCVGAFFLASTGILAGRKCSTHWGFMDRFRLQFPEVEVMDGSIVTEDAGVYSSGGANSYWNLLLHLVEKFVDREMAILLSKYFAIDIDRASQNSFAIFQGQKNHADPQIRKAQEIIEERFDQRISIEELAEAVAIGRRSFERRFKRVTNNSVLEYIQRVKIEAAKRSFEGSLKNINEVMFDVGYTDSKAFRMTFKKVTGITPVEYRKKYNKLSRPN